MAQAARFGGDEASRVGGDERVDFCFLWRIVAAKNNTDNHERRSLRVHRTTLVGAALPRFGDMQYNLSSLYLKM